MRTGLFATIGAIWLAGTGASVAAPINAAAIGEAAEQLSVTESVHCRSFRHWHRWGYSRGCHRVYIDEGVRVRTRIGVHERYGVRSRIGVRDGFRGDTRTGVTIRGDGRSGGATVRGTQGGVTGTQSGVRGGATIGGGTQGGMPGTQSGARGTQGGSMNTAPTGGGAGGGLPGTAGAKQ